MKNLKFALLTIMHLALLTTVLAQDVNSVFKNDTPLTWVGIDFSGALFIGDREKFGSEADIKTLIASWNTLMNDEYEKFNIGETFDKLKVEKAIDITKAHNADLIMTEMLSDDMKDHDHLSPENVQQILYSYDFGDHTGMGLIIVVESFDKLNQQGSMYFTFFDLATREVILSEKMTGKPGGFGLRNFWAGAIYSNMKNIQKKEFEMWRRKYQR